MLSASVCTWHFENTAQSSSKWFSFEMEFIIFSSFYRQIFPTFLIYEKSFTGFELKSITNLKLIITMKYLSKGKKIKQNWKPFKRMFCFKKKTTKCISSLLFVTVVYCCNNSNVYMKHVAVKQLQFKCMINKFLSLVAPPSSPLSSSSSSSFRFKYYTHQIKINWSVRLFERLKMKRLVNIAK